MIVPILYALTAVLVESHSMQQQPLSITLYFDVMGWFLM